jgi:nitrous oxidase accessory protein NosD
VRGGAVLLISTLLAGAVTGLALARGGIHHGRSEANVLYVARTGKSGAADRSCKTAAYPKVQSAVNAAPSGATVVVCRGTYTEDVIIPKSLTLSGHPGAAIHGSKTANGKCDQLGPSGPGKAPCLAAITVKASHVTVEGLRVNGAIGEGVLVTGSLSNGSVNHVRVINNRVVGNNLGGIPPTTESPYPQCVEIGQIPGDCGEGIHLMGVDDSVVRGNYVSQNQGGVLLTDEFGPTHDNVIEDNIITDNPYDCGVTAPGHNPSALGRSGKPRPAVAGVYQNVIRNNQITYNGLKGEGAGVLFANAAPGTASYDNLVTGNYLVGNELSGVTMHAHTLGPNQFEDLNGNRIIDNTIGRNNLGGDPLDGTASDRRTTGVLVFSGTVPVHVRIARNRIRHNHYGIWLGVGGHVTASRSHNVFQDVAIPVFTSP